MPGKLMLTVITHTVLSNYKFFQNDYRSLHLLRSVSSKLHSSGVEDMLFYTITEGKEQVPLSIFTSVSSQTKTIHPSVCLSRFWFHLVHCHPQALKRNGLDPSDPRLKDCMEKLGQAVNESDGEVMMDRELFHRWGSGGTTPWTKETSFP